MKGMVTENKGTHRSCETARKAAIRYRRGRLNGHDVALGCFWVDFGGRSGVRSFMRLERGKSWVGGFVDVGCG